jgi:hypothetical protein
MRNGRDRRLGEPVLGHAILERVRLFGTQSADYITASGHSGRIASEVSLQAKTGRIHDRTRTLRRIVRFLLQRGRRTYMSSRPEEFHPQALPKPCMNLSIHTAPDVRPLP